ncbi:MAG: hypothetical protein AAF903_07710 [Pseudomonadota bacterium]
MFGFLFRAAGLVLLALALVLAVLDITRSISAQAFILTPLANTWASVSADTLAQVKQFLETSLHPLAWDPGLVFLLKLPSWLVLWFFSMVLLWMGQKRETPYGRFASK